MSGRRVVVTGLGIVSPVGLNLKESWDNIVAGNSGVATITEYDTSAFPVTIAATVKNFDASHVIPVKDQRKMDVFIHYGLVAAEEALLDSGIEVTDANADRIGVAIGSGIGGLPMIETSHIKLLEGGPRKVSPFFVPGSIINMISGNFSIMHGIKGPNIALVTACSTGTHNIGQAARIIAYGD
ncbi:MAG: beta-ketoacyl synthase N-terminal-like domain-containing protein, partial [Gammaproteobacteria bacterium]